MYRRRREREDAEKWIDKWSQVLAKMNENKHSIRIMLFLIAFTIIFLVAITMLFTSLIVLGKIS